MYGRPEDPHHSFNIHDSIQNYLSKGVPAEKISLGIHLESKGWVLAEAGNEGAAGIFCDTVEGTPAMAFSGEQGVLLYYEVLQVGWQIHLEGLYPNNPTFHLLL